MMPATNATTAATAAAGRGRGAVTAGTGRGAPITTQTGVTKVTSLSTPTSKRVLSATQSPLPSDPVTKALIDNALGNTTPGQVPKGSFRCDICHLDFSSQMISEAHFYGAKHAKKVKAKELLLEIRKAGDTIKLDERNSIFRCVICNMAFNSIQQLQAHLSGTKHASVKAGDSLPAGAGKPATTSATTTPTTTTAQKTAAVGAASGEANAKKMKMDSNGTEAKPLPKEDAIVTLPSGVVKVDNAQGKSNRYRCTVCQVTVNSDTQLHQHLAAQKHQDKMAGKQNSWWKPGGYKGGSGSATGTQSQKRDYSSYYAGGNDDYYNSTYPTASYSSTSYGSGSYGSGSYGAAGAYAASSYGSGNYGYNSYSDYTDYSYPQDDRSPYPTATSAMFAGSSAAASSAARMGGGSGYSRGITDTSSVMTPMVVSTASFGGMGRAAGLRPNPPRVPRPEQTFVSGGMMK